MLAQQACDHQQVTAETRDPNDPLVAAAADHRAAARDDAAAGRALAKAQQKRTDTRKRLDATRPPLLAAIVEAFTSGRWSQAQIIEETGYSRERVRQILREAGVNPEESAERARESRRRKS